MLQRNKRGVLEETELSFLSRIESNGAHLLTIINDILDLSKVESGRMEVTLGPVDLLMLVRDMAAAFGGTLAGGQVTLALELPAQSAPVPWNARLSGR